jgi:hypothetical protein
MLITKLKNCEKKSKKAKIQEKNREKAPEIP